MGTADGAVVGLTKLVDNGPDAQRLNIVLVAEGFRAAELATFATRCDEFVSSLQAEPWFPALGAAINVYRLNVSSTDSGADDPVACGDGSTGSGAATATFFDASFCISRHPPLPPGRQRSGAHHADRPAAAVARRRRPGQHLPARRLRQRQRVLHRARAPTGGRWCSTSWAMPRSGSRTSTTTGRDVAAARPTATPLATPSSPSSRTSRSRRREPTLKWSNLVTPDDPAADHVEPGLRVLRRACGHVPACPVSIGLFEGAGYFHCDIYRPPTRARCATRPSRSARVCIQAIARRLAMFRPPTPQLEVRTGDGSNLLEFGDVAQRPDDAPLLRGAQRPLGRPWRVAGDGRRTDGALHAARPERRPASCCPPR